MLLNRLALCSWLICLPHNKSLVFKCQKEPSSDNLQDYLLVRLERFDQLKSKVLNENCTTVSLIHNGQISRLRSPTFVGFELKNGSLLLENGNVEKLDSALFRRVQVRKLSLSGNKLRRIERFHFWRADLQELDLSHNLIEMVHKSAFDNLNTLEKINLEGNKLMTLEGSWFRENVALVNINLGDNRIVRLEGHCLQNMNDNRRIELNLSLNPISYVSSEAFEAVNRFRVLNLTGSKIGLGGVEELKKSDKIEQLILF